MTLSPLPDPWLIEGMRVALDAARHGLGTTWPNPPVGAAALDKTGRIIACAAHKNVGGKHAEAALLDILAKQNLMHAVHTLCITLEPCNHQGRTPPCTDLLRASNIRNLAIGVPDPNPDVRGGGIETLHSAGLNISTGILEEECRLLIAPFAAFVTQKRPWITVKRAWQRKADNQRTMIPPNGQKTFMPKPALVLAHRLRKRASAILTGSGTILADNPQLTVRHVPDYSQKVRLLIILDQRRRVPEEWLAACPKRGLTPIVCSHLEEAWDYATKHALVDILVEAGPTLSTAVLASSAWSMCVDIAHSANGDELAQAYADVTFSSATGLRLPDSFTMMDGVTGFPEQWLPV